MVRADFQKHSSVQEMEFITFKLLYRGTWVAQLSIQPVFHSGHEYRVVRLSKLGSALGVQPCIGFSLSLYLCSVPLLIKNSTNKLLYNSVRILLSSKWFYCKIIPRAPHVKWQSQNRFCCFTTGKRRKVSWSTGIGRR